MYIKRKRQSMQGRHTEGMQWKENPLAVPVVTGHMNHASRYIIDSIQIVGIKQTSQERV